MMKIVAVVALVAIVSCEAQRFGSYGFGNPYRTSILGFGGPFGSFGGNSYSSNLASSFGDLGAGLRDISRDPRQNRGPVVFPPAPPDSGDTSGVIVGASGYGFVPPNNPSARPQQFTTSYF